VRVESNYTTRSGGVGGIVETSSHDGRSYSPGKGSSKKNRSSKSRKFSSSNTRQQPNLGIKVNVNPGKSGNVVTTPKNSGYQNIN